MNHMKSKNNMEEGNNNDNHNINNNNGEVVAVDISISGTGGGAAAAGYSRWNPTKEQIDMLESLYKQGIRTPSAEQIQQITARLKAFGHIEGKNVFYWFQNHKARQRQKQKQDSISYFNRFLHHHKPTTTSPNNVCSPFRIPYTDLALSYHHQQQQQPKILLPRAIKRKPLPPEKMSVPATSIKIPIEHVNVTEEYSSSGNNNKQTLDLFPLQPTGDLLQARTSSSSSRPPSTASDLTHESSSSSDKKCTVDVQLGSGSRSSGGGGGGNGNGHLCFFDFFCESH